MKTSMISSRRKHVFALAQTPAPTNVVNSKYQNMPYEATMASAGSCANWGQLEWKQMLRGADATSELGCAAKCYEANENGGQCTVFFLKSGICALTNGECKMGTDTSYAIYNYQLKSVTSTPSTESPATAPVKSTDSPATAPVKSPASPTTSQPRAAVSMIPTPTEVSTGDRYLGSYVCVGGRMFVDSQVQSREECSQLVKWNVDCGSVYTYNQGTGNCHCQRVSSSNEECSTHTPPQTGTFRIEK